MAEGVADQERQWDFFGTGFRHELSPRHLFGLDGVDFQERVNFARLREYRLGRLRTAMGKIQNTTRVFGRLVADPTAGGRVQAGLAGRVDPPEGGLPMVGVLGVPLLALVMPPVAAAALLLPVYIVSDVVGLWAYRHEYSGRNLAILVPAMIFGVAVGWATARVTPPSRRRSWSTSSASIPTASRSSRATPMRWRSAWAPAARARPP